METKFKPIEEIIIEDHNEVKLVWHKYINTPNQDEKFKWYRQFVYLIAKHTIAEEIVFYPLIRERLVDGNILADTDIAQTRRIKQMLVDLRDLKIFDLDCDNKFRACWNEIDEHMSKEEQEDY
jgi:hemerythrin superfamily protein